jgi:hypothetical protein
MWVSKTPEENERDVRKEASIKGALVASVILVLASLVFKLGYSRSRGAIDPISWTEFLHYIPWILGISTVTFFFFYSQAKNEEKYIRSKTLVCLNCDESPEGNGEITCKCGAVLVDLNHAKWINKERSVH